jgi:hypothetical protein
LFLYQILWVLYSPASPVRFLKTNSTNATTRKQKLCFIRWWGLLYPSTQRRYRRLIDYLYIILLHVSVLRSPGIKYIIARITQLTTDPLFYNITIN